MAEAPRSISGVLPTLHDVRRLRKNINGYFGERIDIAAALEDCAAAARAHGWQIEQIPVDSKLGLMALSRKASEPSTASGPRSGPAGATAPPRIYMSSGIHGDEPAGPLAMRQLLHEDKWPRGVDFWLCPCLNPAGFELNRRENANGLDLNRQYRQPTAPETIAHMAWLERQPPFDLSLCLHEDWESHGFYVYELNPDDRPSLAKGIVESVAKVCPIDRSDLIEGRQAQEGIIRPGIDPRSRPDWPEAFFLITRKTRLSYTLESPSDFPLAARVAALVAAVQAAVERSKVES